MFVDLPRVATDLREESDTYDAIARAVRDDRLRILHELQENGEAEIVLPDGRRYTLRAKQRQRVGASAR